MAAATDSVSFEPTLRNVVEQTSLKWVFVGGKGGVGKTTVSCSLAIQLSKVRDRVLIVSTDPAHNLSDTFSQQLSGTPTLVQGFTNLFAMEQSIVRRTPTERPTEANTAQPSTTEASATGASFTEESIWQELEGMMQDTNPGFMPGFDELGVISLLDSLAGDTRFSVVVFDTAPTGHTLRLLAMPGMFQRLTEKLPPHLISILSQIASMVPGLNLGMSQIRDPHGKVQRLLQNANHTTFVCVCLAEFLPLYETERLAQALCRYGVDSHNIVVNQLNIWPTTQPTPCPTCSAHNKLQRKYLEQIDDLYEDRHVIKLPMLAKEVRGVDSLLDFSQYLLRPYTPDQSAWP